MAGKTEFQKLVGAHFGIYGFLAFALPNLKSDKEQS